jgi:biopolymer transport protein ExbD
LDASGPTRPVSDPHDPRRRPVSDLRRRKRHKKKVAKKKRQKYKDIGLNVMPFIDVFSLLNTFLLMSAVFLSVGILEVQIPFLSPQKPDKEQDDKACDVKVDMTKEKVEATATNCKVDPKKEFQISDAGMKELHKYLVDVRRANQDTDKLQLFTEDDVIWKDIAKALDAIKLRLPGDPVFTLTTGSDIDKALAAEFLFPKVVMASVML